MQLLAFVSSFGKSRQKLLLKRRKIQVKNRPVSKTYLKEERKVMNYSFESKLMDIKKALDKKKSQNHHINEIIEELFYPDIRPQHSSLIESKVKQ
jgi:disulfide oxidoreductase YuzD